MYSLPSDLDSTAGSECNWDEGGNSSAAQFSAISKEQLFQMLQKMRMRYHKYKGRYADLANAYKELESENQKVRNVMQQTQVRFKDNKIHTALYCNNYYVLSTWQGSLIK